MRYFYWLMVRLSDIELQIAQSTGRNPENIRLLKKQLAYWEGERDRYEVRYV